MKYLPILTEDELFYICSVIPLEDSIWYFKHNPKNFAKVMPGFRPTSLRKEQISDLLFRSRNQSFISSFIEDHISRWLVQINAAIKEKADKGESKESVLLQILPNCFFVDNIGLYFKLTGEEYSEDYLALLSESLKTIKEATKERNQAIIRLEAKTGAVSSLESELMHIQNEHIKINKRLNERIDEIKALKRTNADLEKNKSVIASLEQIVTNLKDKVQKCEDSIQQQRTELAFAKQERINLEQTIKERLIKQKEIERHNQEFARLPKHPKDLEEFKVYLGYNFENIGIPPTADYYPLLLGHICELLFQGKPIVVSRSVGMSLMKCVSNALLKSLVVPSMAFTIDATEIAIDSFLSQEKRVLCLDNFIGNFNETILVAICERHRDKIIFLTVAYDHTLAYVADEFLKYCHYINLSRIKVFAEANELTEEPSAVDEESVPIKHVESDYRWSIALKNICEELGIFGGVATYKSSLVTNELCFCQLLVFDILPYCSDVLKIAPFNTSDSLLKYAGSNGRCRYKDLFRRWFS